MGECVGLGARCAPGGRGVNGLEPGLDRAALESAFALIREAAEWLRAGRELGFGALADPHGWLERIEGPSMALEPGEFLDAASLRETAGRGGRRGCGETGKSTAFGAPGTRRGGF